MKKLWAVLIIATGLLALSLTTHFLQPKAFADCDSSHFPYNFMTNSGFGQGTNASLAVTNSPAGTTNNGGTYTLPSGSQSITLNASYNNSGNNCGGGAKAPGGGAAKVLDWVTIDVNDSVLNGNPTGGTVTGCPGTGSTESPFYKPIYNDQDLQLGSGSSVAPDPTYHGVEGSSASPIAYNAATGGGIENCETQGKVVYWEDGSGSTGGSHNFTLNLNGVYSTFCVTENVSVEFPGDAGLFYSSADDGRNGDPNSSASHVAQQSNGICIHTQQPKACTGCSCPGADCTSPAVYETATCTTTDAGDPGVTSYETPAANPDGADTRFADYSDPGSSVGWSTTNVGTTPKARTVVTVTDSSGATLVSDVIGNSLDSSGGSRNSAGQLYLGNHWAYTPNGETVNFTFDHEERLLANNGSYYWVLYSQSGSGSHGPCYTATCSLTVVPNVPGATASGAVKANQGFAIRATITNTGGVDGNTTLPDTLSGDFFSLTQSNGGSAIHNEISGLAPGNSDKITLSQGAPSSGTYSISYYTDYWQNPYMVSQGFGSGCSATVNVYAPFSLTPNANTILYNSKTGQTDEDPDTVVNNAWVTESGATVSENTSAVIYERPAAGGVIIVGSKPNGGPFSNGSTTCLYQGAAPNNVPGCASFVDGTYAPSQPLEAGDTYCTDMKVPYTSDATHQAYVGPGNDIVDAVPGIATTCPPVNPGGGGGPGCIFGQPECPNCETVNPDCPGGGGGGGGCPTGGCPGEITNKPFFKVNNGTVSAGGAFKSGTPTCSGGGNLGGWNDNTGLNPAPGDYGAAAQIGALALNPTIGVASNQSAFGNSPLGLSFANTNAADKSVDPYSPKLGGDFNPGGASCFTEVTAPTGGDFTNYPSSQSFPSGFNGPSSIAAGDNKTIFVTGDVYIGGNVIYSSGGWALTGAGSTIPSFVLKATGNIYIGQNVTELDGLYESTGGKIYTCGTAYAPMPTNDLYDQCNKQLSVYGKFVAKQVDMMRTFGSLRDDAPVASATMPVTTTNPPLGLVWSEGGRITGMQCDSFNEPAEPGSHTWSDNYLCRPPGSPLTGVCFETNGAAYGCTGCNFQQIDPSSSPYYSRLPGYWQDDATCFYPQSSPPGNGMSFSWGSPPAGSTVAPGDYHTDGVTGQKFAAHYTLGNQYCTLTFEDSDPDTAPNGDLIWEHTYICETLGTTTSTVVTGEHSPYPETCSNGSGLVVNTCAAEVFYSTPELDLSSPNIGEPSNGAQQWDSITSLPPIL